MCLILSWHVNQGEGISSEDEPVFWGREAGGWVKSENQARDFGYLKKQQRGGGISANASTNK